MSGVARPTRATTRRTRMSMKDAAREMPSKRVDEQEEEEEEEEDEEEEEEEEEDEIEDMDSELGEGFAADDEHSDGSQSTSQRSSGRTTGRRTRQGSDDTITGAQVFVKGSLVQILQTPDVEQRVPHTIQKVGIVEQVPQHPNTWYKVRIRDGDVVYKYRPSALQLIEQGWRQEEEAEQESNGSEHPSDHEGNDSEDDGEEMSGDDAMNSEEMAHEGNYGHAEDGSDTYPTRQQRVRKQSDAQDIAPDDLHFKIGARVRVHLTTISRRERDLRKYQNKLGTIIEYEAGSWKVEVDGNEKNGAIIFQQRHLQVIDNDLEEEPDQQNDAEETHEDLDVSRQTDNASKGQLLSDLDPEMWIDRWCRINVGKFKGMNGRVLRSGNGWVQLRLDESSENTAKRAYELTLLEDMDTIKKLYAESLKEQSNAKEKNTANDDNEDDDGNESTRSGTEDNANAEQTDDSQEEGSQSGKRARRLSTRGSYGISWIERKVVLPNRKGFGIVKRAERDTCTVEVSHTKALKVFKKKDLELVEEDTSKLGRGARNRNSSKARERNALPEGVVLMGTTPGRYAAFQDQVKKFISRKRERVKRRPNLQEWQAKLDTKYRPASHSDETNPALQDLLVVPQCEICGMEKEGEGAPCWNSACPRCFSFDVESHVTSKDQFVRFPIIPIKSDLVSSRILSFLERRKRKKAIQSDPNAPQNELGAVGSDIKEGAPQKKRKDTDSKKGPPSKKRAAGGEDTKKSKSTSKKLKSGTKEKRSNVSSDRVSDHSLPNTMRPRYENVFGR